MKLCFYDLNLGNPKIKSIFGGMYASFWQALENNNVKVNYTQSLNSLNGDILVVALGGGQELKSARAMARFNGPVIIYVPPAYSWFYASYLKRWKGKILFSYGTDFSQLSFEKYKSLGINYYHLPFASDESIFYPIDLPNIYDIIFVGNANSGIGRYKYTNPLIHKAKEKGWNILLLGTGWEKYGFPFQIISHGKLLSAIYNMGKICINLHNDIQYLGCDLQMDANNRVFDLAMAGCFQINNAKDLIAKYFDKEEVVAVDNPEEFIEKIEFYLENEKERKNFELKSLQKARLKHNWNNRALSFIAYIEENKQFYMLQNYKKNPYLTFLKKYDQSCLPMYIVKRKLSSLINKIRNP